MYFDTSNMLIGCIFLRAYSLSLWFERFHENKHGKKHTSVNNCTGHSKSFTWNSLKVLYISYVRSQTNYVKKETYKIVKY